MIGLTIPTNSYYVYLHSYKGEVFYVGMGKGGRAFNLTDPSRGKRWHEFAKSLPSFDVKIIAQFDKREAALEFEKKKIEELKPVGNTHGLRRFQKPSKYAVPLSVEEMGRLGGLATAKKLSKKKRKENARKAAIARWRK